jgi:hypothetical protein
MISWGGVIVVSFSVVPGVIVALRGATPERRSSR